MDTPSTYLPTPHNLHPALLQAGKKKTNKDGFMQEYNQVKESMEKALEAQQAILQQVRQLRHKQRSLAQTVDEHRKKMRDAQLKATSQEKQFEEDAEQVKQCYPERAVDADKRSTAELERALKKAVKTIHTAQRRHGGKSLYQLEVEANAKRKQLIKKQEDAFTTKATLQMTKTSFAQRFKFFRKNCKLKGKQATSDFNDRLTRKGHAGRLSYDHEEETLTLEVSRDNQDSCGASTTDARNLSGGERSFTTLCYELAMWEFCEAPIRVLDEFDVYMDDTYRRIAVDTLLELCDSQPRRQFLFITPQDMHPFLVAREEAGGSLPRIIKMSNVR